MWKGHARVHSVLQKQLLRSPESVHIKGRGNMWTFHLDIEKCPLWLGVQIKWVSVGQPGSMWVIFVLSFLVCKTVIGHGSESCHEVFNEICIVEIKRTKNILRNIFCYLKALKAFRGFPWTIFPFPSLVCIVVLLFEQVMPTYRTISVYSIAFMYICKKLRSWTDWKLLHFRWQWYLMKRVSRI